MSQSYPRGKVHIDTSQDPCILMLLMTGKVQPFVEYWHGPGRKSRVPERGTHCVEVWLDPLDNSLVTQRSVETWGLDHRSQSSTIFEREMWSHLRCGRCIKKVFLWPGPTGPKCVFQFSEIAFFFSRSPPLVWTWPVSLHWSQRQGMDGLEKRRKLWICLPWKEDFKRSQDLSQKLRTLDAETCLKRVLAMDFKVFTWFWWYMINLINHKTIRCCTMYYISLSLIIIIILIIMIIGFYKSRIGRYQTIRHHVMPAKDKDNRLSDEETKTVRSGGQPLSQEDSNAPTQLPSRLALGLNTLEMAWCLAPLPAKKWPKSKC